MPYLCDISYSQDACVAAVRDYYQFLAQLYLDESFILEPPATGWPFNADSLQELGKSDEVISLLRHLPYIRDDNVTEVNAASNCVFADWQRWARLIREGHSIGEDARLMTEKWNLFEILPLHVVSLTDGNEYNPIFLLDTELGIVLWHQCPTEIWLESPWEPIQDDPWEYTEDDDEQAQWRADSTAWAIGDFFEVLKHQFRTMYMVPFGRRTVRSVNTLFSRPSGKDSIPVVQKILREHGWPDMQQYRKEECLVAIHEALKKQFPDMEEWDFYGS